jgi:hypothetical protein
VAGRAYRLAGDKHWRRSEFNKESNQVVLVMSKRHDCFPASIVFSRRVSPSRLQRTQGPPFERSLCPPHGKQHMVGTIMRSHAIRRRTCSARGYGMQPRQVGAPHRASLANKACRARYSRRRAAPIPLAAIMRPFVQAGKGRERRSSSIATNVNVARVTRFVSSPALSRLHASTAMRIDERPVLISFA